MTINYDLIARVKDTIRREPEHFNMTKWAGAIYENGIRCGTAACIGGWTVMLARGIPLDTAVKTFGCIEDEAIGALTGGNTRVWGTYTELRAAEELEDMFYLSRWPLDLFTQYYQDDAVEAACEAIDFFVARAERILDGEPRESYLDSSGTMR